MVIVATQSQAQSIAVLDWKMRSKANPTASSWTAARNAAHAMEPSTRRCRQSETAMANATRASDPSVSTQPIVDDKAGLRAVCGDGGTVIPPALESGYVDNAWYPEPASRHLPR